MKISLKKEISVIVPIFLMLTFIVMPIVIMLVDNVLDKTPLEILRFYGDFFDNISWTRTVVSMTIFSIILRLLHRLISYLKNRFGKRKLALSSFIIVFVSLLISGETSWEHEFLPWLRYRDYTVHRSQPNNYLNLWPLSDTTFAYSRRFSVSEDRTLVTWRGDTRHIVSISCGVYYYRPPSEVFSGYDTTLVRFIDGHVEPLRVGESPLIVNYSESSDTLQIIVSREDAHLSLDIR